MSCCDGVRQMFCKLRHDPRRHCPACNLRKSRETFSLLRSGSYLHVNALQPFAFSMKSGVVLGRALFACGQRREVTLWNRRNVDVLYEYLMHRLYGHALKSAPNVPSRDSLFVPGGWDSRDRIDKTASSLEHGLERSFESSVVSLDPAPPAPPPVVQYEDMQKFLKSSAAVLQKLGAVSARSDKAKASLAAATGAGAKKATEITAAGSGKRASIDASAKGGIGKEDKASVANFFQNLLTRGQSGAALGADKRPSSASTAAGAPAAPKAEARMQGVRLSVLSLGEEGLRKQFQYPQPTMMECDPSSAFFGFMGVTSALVFANLGAAYGTAKSGVGIASMGVMRPDMIMKSIIPVVMAGVLGIYGLITAVIINGKMDAANYSAYSGYAHLGAGLTVGMSSLAAGLAIGIVGDAGVRANAQQPRLFVGMILILIFAEALGLYGLIVGLVVASTAEGKGPVTNERDFALLMLEGDLMRPDGVNSVLVLQSDRSLRSAWSWQTCLRLSGQAQTM
eukprot:s3456_g3.t1